MGTLIVNDPADELVSQCPNCVDDPSMFTCKTNGMGVLLVDIVMAILILFLPSVTTVLFIICSSVECQVLMLA